MGEFNTSFRAKKIEDPLYMHYFGLKKHHSPNPTQVEEVS